MALLRSQRRVQVLSAEWRIVTRSNTTNPSEKSEQQERQPYWYKSMNGKVQSFDQIPGPKFLPFIGHEWRYTLGLYNHDRIHHTFAKLFRKYGNVVREHIGEKRVVVHIFHPEDMRMVYQKDGMHPTRLSHRVMARYRRERPHLYASAGLGPSNGDEWHQFRSQFNKVNHVFAEEELEKQLELVADDLVNAVRAKVDEKGEVDVLPLLYRWTLEGVGLSTLNRRLRCLDANHRADALVEAAHVTNDCIYRTETTASGHEHQYNRLVPAQDYFSKVVRQYIQEALSNMPIRKNPLLQAVLTPDSDMKDVATFILDLFQGGIHTTAVTTAFALYHLALNPKVQDKLRASLVEQMPNKDSPVVGAEANESRYLRYVIFETLRMNPPTIGNGRIIQKNLVLGGYEMPQGTMVILHHQVASRQDKFFGEASSFIPERFDLNAEKHLRPKHFMASQPFGFGARTCIGQVLARAEMRLALSKFIRNFEISYHYGKIDTVNRLHNEPDKPVKLRLKPVSY